MFRVVRSVLVLYMQWCFFVSWSFVVEKYMLSLHGLVCVCVFLVCVRVCMCVCACGVCVCAPETASAAAWHQLNLRTNPNLNLGIPHIPPQVRHKSHH